MANPIFFPSVVFAADICTAVFTQLREPGILPGYGEDVRGELRLARDAEIDGSQQAAELKDRVQVSLSATRELIQADLVELSKQQTLSYADLRQASYYFHSLEYLNRLEKFYSYRKPTLIEKERFETLVEHLENSHTLRLFNKNMELPISTMTLKLGKSYVVLIHKNKLIVGDKTGGEGGATAGTHIRLARNAGGLSEDFGGSIRFNLDGSIEVSGYHSKRKSEIAANQIAAILKAAVPEGTRIRTTAGRLTALEFDGEI